MARPRIGGKPVLVQIPDDLLARLDAVCGPSGRAKWIRQAIEEKLAPPMTSEKSTPPDRPAEDVDLRRDGEVLLDLLREGRTLAEASEALRWPMTKTTNVWVALRDAGLVRAS